MQKEDLKKILTKASLIEKNQPIAIARNFIALEDKIDGVREELKKKLESELVLEIDREELKGDKGEQGEKGEPGKDGNDGKNGKAGKAGKDGKDGKDGIDGIDGEKGETGEKGKDGKDANIDDVKEKLESLKGDDRLDAKAIKNLPEGKGSNYGAVASIKDITAGDGILVDNTLLGHPKISLDGTIPTSHTELTDIGTLTHDELETSLDNKITGDGIAKITVSATPPSNPAIGDLWVELT